MAFTNIKKMELKSSPLYLPDKHFLYEATSDRED